MLAMENTLFIAAMPGFCLHVKVTRYSDVGQYENYHKQAGYYDPSCRSSSARTTWGLAFPEAFLTTWPKRKLTTAVFPDL
jgi:hypothetical protein